MSLLPLLSAPLNQHRSNIAVSNPAQHYPANPAPALPAPSHYSATDITGCRLKLLSPSSPAAPGGLGELHAAAMSQGLYVQRNTQLLASGLFEVNYVNMVCSY